MLFAHGEKEGGELHLGEEVGVLGGEEVVGLGEEGAEALLVVGSFYVAVGEPGGVTYDEAELAMGQEGGLVGVSEDEFPDGVGGGFLEEPAHESEVAVPGGDLVWGEV